MSLKPDVAVFQEASQSKFLQCADFWYGNHHKNGIAILVQDKLTAKIGPIDNNAQWSIVPITVSGEFSFNLLAVWTRVERKYILSLDKALDIYADFLKKSPSVIIGDFNANAIWDNPNKDTDFTRVANRLENEFCLRSAYHDFYDEKYGEETHATHHFRWHKDEPFHIDYCFIPAAWKLQKVQVGSYDDWGATSDHCPLIVDIDLQSKSVESDAGMDFRNYRKVLRMVAELHLRGYQRIRIAPGMSPSGCHWRCAITPVDNISRNNGAKISKWGFLSAEYTSGQGENYFGWEDASHASPSQLADIFIKRFPRIAEAGYGADWTYAGWYMEMLHLTYPESFPIAYADWDLPKDHMPSTGRDNNIKIPLPPSGVGI